MANNLFPLFSANTCLQPVSGILNFVQEVILGKGYYDFLQLLPEKQKHWLLLPRPYVWSVGCQIGIGIRPFAVACQLFPNEMNEACTFLYQSRSARCQWLLLELLKGRHFLWPQQDCRDYQTASLALAID